MGDLSDYGEMYEHMFDKVKEGQPHTAVDGVGPEAPSVENEHGGKQSDVPFAFDCFDAQAMFAMARVLKEGADKYGKDNWRLIPEQDHVNHLLMHIFAYQAGDTSDDHISHIMCRAMFLAGMHYSSEKARNADPARSTAWMPDSTGTKFVRANPEDAPRVG